MMRTSRLFILCVGVIFAAQGQTQIQVPVASVAAFQEESVVPLGGVGGASALTIPGDVLGAIQGGAQEIHQTLAYDPIQNTLQVTGFAVAVGSPVPARVGSAGLRVASAAAATGNLWSYKVNVASAQTAAQPRNTLTFAGTVASADLSAFGDLTGASVAVSMSYSGTGSQAQFSAVTVSLVGIASVFAPAGAGSIQTVTATSAPTAVAGPKGVSTTALTFQLSGAGSTDPAGSPLKYQWQFLPVGGQTVGIDNTQSAAPFISFPMNNIFAYGDYTFRLTVTNAAGLSSVDTVTVTFSSNQR